RPGGSRGGAPPPPAPTRGQDAAANGRGQGPAAGRLQPLQNTTLVQAPFSTLLTHHVAHDRPCRRPPDNLDKTSLEEGRGEAGVDERVGETALPRLDRVALNDTRALSPRVVHSSLQQPAGNSLAPVGTGHEETNNRPDRLVVHGLEHARAFQPRVVGARLQGAPAYWLAAVISEHAGNR